jgi:hypothetical protein
MSAQVQVHVMRLGRAILAMLAVFPCFAAAAGALRDGDSLDCTWLAQNYTQEVARCLKVPVAKQQARTLPDGANPTFHFISASSSSTGKPGSFDHFLTPNYVRNS